MYNVTWKVIDETAELRLMESFPDMNKLILMIQPFLQALKLYAYTCITNQSDVVYDKHKQLKALP
jgi:hypothetical protein